MIATWVKECSNDLARLSMPDKDKQCLNQYLEKTHGRISANQT
jgi:hypothetical protein